MQLQQFDLVLFGATGDLVTRKLLPTLYKIYTNNCLHSQARIFAVGRRGFTDEEFYQFVYNKTTEMNNTMDHTLWQKFTQLVKYIQIDMDNSTDYIKLAKMLNVSITNIYFLSTDQGLFKPICDNLSKHKLNHPNSRIVLEKPLGHNLQTSNDINDFVAKFFNENQIYRIDHYLGKESVQNLMAIRFGNTLFEALWRRQWVAHIQITIAETLGVENRGTFYDKTGALRDMLQNHLLQLLCIVAMEPPFSLAADTIRDEKLKVLKSLKNFTHEMVMENVICGQYIAGNTDGKVLKAYVDEHQVRPNSNTETYVALKTEIQNWRWAGVPFYLRTGKRMKKQLAEIVVQFKDIPCNIFPINKNNQANRLIIRLQPDERIQLYFLAKKPGDTNNLNPVFLDLDLHKTFTDNNSSNGYERLLLDIIRGNLTLFVRRDEQEAAWQWVDPILNTWKNMNIIPTHYSSGTWGPNSASQLLSRDNAIWHEEVLL
jgi:glucose-6-phosphate 1-dehydrogenase